MAEFGASITGLFDAIRDMQKAKAIGVDRSVYVVSTDINKAPYAWWQEFGTRFHPPQPYMRPAVNEAVRERGKIVQKAEQAADTLVGGDFDEILVKTFAQQVMIKAKKKAPVDTGTLRDTIFMEKVR